jgi:hypothetical protein
MSTTLENLQADLTRANEAYNNAVAAVSAHPSTQNLDTLQRVATSRNQLQQRIAAAEAEANRREANTTVSVVELVSAGKSNTSVSVQPGTTVRDAVVSAGWNANQVSFNVVNGSNFTAVPADWRIPAGVTKIMVQPQVRGGARVK